MVRKTPLGFAVALLTAGSLAWADVPDIVYVQGALRTEAGSPANGTFDIAVRLYSGESGGIPFWESTFPDVSVEDGFFDVLLGSDPLSPLPETLFAEHPTVWLAVVILAPDPEPELPRQRLASVPFALESLHAGTASGLSCEGCVQATHVGFPYAKSATPNGAAVGLECFECVDPSEVKINYAGSDEQGGAASDVDCDGCISALELDEQSVDARYVLKSGDTVNGALGVDGALTATSLAGDGSQLTGVKIAGGSCGDGEYVVGVNTDGSVQCSSDPVGSCAGYGLGAVVNDGHLTAGEDRELQYSPTTPGAGVLKANWPAVEGATSYAVAVGTAPGGDDVKAFTDVGDVTSGTLSGLSLQGAWTGTVYFVSVRVVCSGVPTGAAITSNGVRIAEKAVWDGAGVGGLRNAVDGGYFSNFPTGSGWDVLHGEHYFESVQIPAGTVVHVTPFGKVDGVPAGVSVSDARVMTPRDGWLALYANDIVIDGTIDASGRGYGGAGGAGSSNSSSSGGAGGAGGLSGDGATPGGKGLGAAGGGGSACGGYKGGDGGARGGAGGGAVCVEAGQSGSEAGGGAGADGPPGPVGGAGGANPYGGGTGGKGYSGGSDCGNDGGGGGGAGYGAGGGAGVHCGSGGGGGGTGGGSGYGSHGLGRGQSGGASATSYMQPGKAGGYGAAGTNSDSSSDQSVMLGSGGGGAGQLGPGCNPCEGGGGGGAGGGAIHLFATRTLTLGSTAKLIAVGAAGGGGSGQDNRGSSGGGGGGGGGGVLMCAGALTLDAGASIDARGGTDGGSPNTGASLGGSGGAGGASAANGGTIKLFYDTRSGGAPAPGGGRLFDAGAGSGTCLP